jgi:hypothetical protein
MTTHYFAIEPFIEALEKLAPGTQIDAAAIASDLRKMTAPETPAGEVQRRYTLALLPQRGDVYHWEPLSSVATCRLVVLGVEWNGEEWWITAQRVRGIGNMPDPKHKPSPNTFGRWREATILVAPADEFDPLP